MTIQEQAKELVNQFHNYIHITREDFDEMVEHDTGMVRYSVRAAIFHCQSIKKIWENDFYGMVLTQKYRDRCLQNAEHYTKLLNELNKML
jgi:hypothetical protein